MFYLMEYEYWPITGRHRLVIFITEHAGELDKKIATQTDIDSMNITVYGGFHSLEEARRFIVDNFSSRSGELCAITARALLSPKDVESITWETTDKEIEEMSSVYEEVSARLGVSIGSHVKDSLVSIRKERRNYKMYADYLAAQGIS